MNSTLSAENSVTTDTARKRGRPSTYSVGITEAICERLALGQSLRQICCDETMPSRRAVFQWLAKYPQFARQYAAARSEQVYRLADEVLDIADGEPDIARAQRMIDARFAWIGRLRPRK